MKTFEELTGLNESTENIMQIKFTKDEIFFYVTDIKDKEKTAKRFLELCIISINNPEMIYHAFELCQDKSIGKKSWIKKAISAIKKHGFRWEKRR